VTFASARFRIGLCIAFSVIAFSSIRSMARPAVQFAKLTPYSVLDTIINVVFVLRTDETILQE
jgi:hypothetical protein